MYTVTVDFVVKPEHQAEFRRAILEQAQSSLAEDRGCRRFDVVVSVDDPNHIFLYELYDDLSCFEEHGRAPHTKRVSEIVGPLLVSRNLRCFETLLVT